MMYGSESNDSVGYPIILFFLKSTINELLDLRKFLKSLVFTLFAINALNSGELLLTLSTTLWLRVRVNPDNSPTPASVIKPPNHLPRILLSSVAALLNIPKMRWFIYFHFL